MKLKRRKNINDKKNEAITDATSYFKSNYLKVSFPVIKHYDLSTAVFIACLYSWWNTFKEKGQITKNGFFFQTQKQIKELVDLSFSKQKMIADQLIKDKVLEVKRIGLPARNYYRLNPDILWNIINKNDILLDLSELTGQETENQDTTLSEIKIDNKNKYNKNNIISPKEDINKISSKDDIRLSSESLPASQSENPSHKDSRLLQNRKITYSKDVERLFDFWNDRGPPLTSHRRDTKTYHNSCKKLLTALETNPLNRIMTSMLNYHDLITDPSNNIAHKASIGLPGCKVNLIEFFGFSKRTKEAMKLRKINLPIKSWFDECVKNKSPALDKKFGMFIEDPYPDISDKFRKLWFKKMGVGKINATGENKIRKASVMFNDFMDVNLDSMILGTREKRYIYELVDHVFQAIDADVKSDWLVVTVGWLCSKRTYDIRLPLHLSRLGILEREEKEDKEETDDGFSIY